MKMLQKFIALLLGQLAIFGSIPSQTNGQSMETTSSLHYVIRESKDAARESPLLILLHGHGSNENDLFSLHTQVPPDWIVVSVRGPYQLAEHSYRWYDVKMVNGRIAINIEEEERSRGELLQLIGEITARYHVDRSRIVVAGFSQGANMAQSLGLGEPSLVAGFGVFSGRYVEEFRPYISQADRLRDIKAFVSHGSGDNMLPKSHAAGNILELGKLGIQLTYCEDSNGHSISARQWNEFSKWLLNFNSPAETDQGKGRH